jgi:molecular chaperone GrpE
MKSEPEFQDPAQADASAAPEPPQTLDELMRVASTRISELEAEAQSLRDRWMRAEAETANVRARAKREVEEARLFAVQAIARDMAEVGENLRRGLDSLPKPTTDEPEMVSRLREGFASIERSFLAALERNGVRRDDPTGAAFDPNLHQAMAEQENAEHPPGTVLQAWTPAWTLNGRLLRPAMVVVAKAVPAEIAAPGERARGTAHGTAHGGAHSGAGGAGPNFDRTA